MLTITQLKLSLPDTKWLSNIKDISGYCKGKEIQNRLLKDRNRTINVFYFWRGG